MTLDQLLSEPLPPLSELRDMWLVFSETLKETLESSQEVGSSLMVIPFALTNGKYAICADLLTEAQGAYARAYSNLDSNSFQFVDVIEGISNLPIDAET